MSAEEIVAAQPIAEGTEYDEKENVVLIPTGSEKKYLVSRQGLMRFSKLARNLLENADDSEPLQLDNPHCTEDSVAAFAVWVNKHTDRDVAVTKITYPMAAGELKDIFTDWDLQFIHALLVDGKNEQPMKNNKNLFALAGLSVYLNTTILQELCCGYFAWWVRKVTDDSKADGAPTATSMVRGWFGLEGDFTEDELKGIVEKYKWCKDVDYNQIEKDSEEAHEFADKFTS